jgi:regulator of cell morphogenesis and NO signaling
MPITADSTVGTVAAEHPLATRVFARRGIDFCCAGGLDLGTACDAKGVDVATFIDELEQEIAGRDETVERWDDKPLDVLIDHILDVYHVPLKEELPRLEEMMRKVHRVHGSKDQARFDALLQTVLAIKADIDDHLPKEEEILFPMIKAGQGGMAMAPMQVMEMEHETLGGMLRKVRDLTDEYTVPEGACNTWRALWVGLEDLERSLHEHIHLENNILHPRARES